MKKTELASKVFAILMSVISLCEEIAEAEKGKWAARRAERLAEAKAEAQAEGQRRAEEEIRELRYNTASSRLEKEFREGKLTEEEYLAKMEAAIRLHHS